MRRSNSPVPYVPQDDLRKTILEKYHDRQPMVRISDEMKLSTNLKNDIFDR